MFVKIIRLICIISISSMIQPVVFAAAAPAKLTLHNYTSAQLTIVYKCADKAQQSIVFRPGSSFTTTISPTAGYSTCTISVCYTPEGDKTTPPQSTLCDSLSLKTQSLGNINYRSDGMLQATQCSAEPWQSINCHASPLTWSSNLTVTFTPTQP